MNATEEQQQQNHHREAVWTLPCHFHTLSLMNCKSRAEAFARSLHTKLKSLGRLATDDDEEEEEEGGGGGVNNVNPFATAPTSSSSPTSIRIKENEKTHLISAPHHGSPAESFLSQHGEDELYFDFDISSPESPAEHEELCVNRPTSIHREQNLGKNERHFRDSLVTRQPKSRSNVASRSNSDSERGHALCACNSHAELRHGSSNSDLERGHAPCACSTFSSSLEFTNSNLRQLDAADGDEESGCISAVSSVLTEQDNDEIDEDEDEDDDGELFGLNDFEDAADLYPWSPPKAGHYPPQSCSPSTVMPPDGPLFNSLPLTSPTSSRKLTTIVEQATLELESASELDEPSDDVEEWPAGEALLESNDLVQGHCQCGYVAEAGLALLDDKDDGQEAAFMLNDGLLAKEDISLTENQQQIDSGVWKEMPSIEGPTPRRVRPDEGSLDRESDDIQPEGKQQGEDSEPSECDKNVRHACESFPDPREAREETADEREEIVRRTCFSPPLFSRDLRESSEETTGDNEQTVGEVGASPVDLQPREDENGRQSEAMVCQECVSLAPSFFPNSEESSSQRPESNSDSEIQEAGGERGETVCQVCVSPPPTSLNLRKSPRDQLDFSSDGPTSQHQQLTVNVNLSPATSSDDLLSPNPDDDEPRKVRRSSSLKTCKTPPGTPNRKKIVRFADAMGLDLEAVKHVFLDDLPTVPSSAFVDLQDAACLNDDEEDHLGAAGLTVYNSQLGFGLSRQPRSLVPVFPQPASLTDFIERVRRQSVCLESAVLAGDSSVRLVVRVLNLDFHKSVTVRYTINEWATVRHTLAEYVQGSHDGFSDKFATVLSTDEVQVGDRLQFAIQYVTRSGEFWDNNYGQNYSFQCFPEQQYQPSPTDDSWVHFL